MSVAIELTKEILKGVSQMESLVNRLKKLKKHNKSRKRDTVNGAPSQSVKWLENQEKCMSGEKVWNSLDVTKLIVSVLTPSLLFWLGYLVSDATKQTDRKINIRMIKVLGLKAHEYLCLFLAVPPPIPL